MFEIVAPFVAFALMVAIILFLKWKAERDAPKIVGEWVCALTHAADVTPYHLDYFPIMSEENPLADELEDEAASMGLFCCYDQLDQLKPDDRVAVSHPVHGSFFFHPDYEEGFLIGVRAVPVVLDAE